MHDPRELVRKLVPKRAKTSSFAATLQPQAASVSFSPSSQEKNVRILLFVVLTLFSTALLAFAQNDPILARFLPQAQAGDAQAQYTVGARYYQMQDLPNAKLWLQKSAAQGNQQAAGFLNMINGGGSTPGRPAAMPGNTATPVSGGMAGATGLCPGTGESLEKNGIGSVLQQAMRQISLDLAAALLR
jgi:TPR repeat protein